MSRVVRTLAVALAALLWVSGCSTEADEPVRPVTGNTTAELRDSAVRVAEQTAIAVTSLDHRDAEAGYDRLLDLLTGPARQERERRRAENLATIAADAVTAEDAAVTASGVAALDPAVPSVTVLVAATARIASKQTPTAEQRRYRLRMSLVRAAGEWKVSELQFVS